ncbi:M56 family metallopeptidase [Thermoactinospora rubra]|uniref:M56 family metallopeptidase n=1 Tax=Thermoactinospora rubra TaxID=1088767 RepID=UPI00117F6431|nr:M56 family metallopeptidase [Thermoactinospora rubra]
MVVPLILTLYGVAAAVLLPRLLARGTWADRAPRLAITVWLASCVSCVAAVVLAGLAVAVPASMVGHGLAHLFEVCAAMLADVTAMSSMDARLALLVSAALTVRLAYCAAVVLLRARRERRQHADMLALLGRHDGDLGAVVLTYDEPVAYCLPGRRGTTVITTGALRALSRPEAAAVLAHERAHLRGRHHLPLAATDAMARAFPRVPLFDRARSEVARLVELLADDVAARRHPRLHLAAALVRLATGRPPAFALGAGGGTAITRLRRLLAPESPLSRHERWAGMAVVAALLAGPAAVAAWPGVSAFLAQHCLEVHDCVDTGLFH